MKRLKFFLMLFLSGVSAQSFAFIQAGLGGGYAFLTMIYSNATGGEMLNFKYYSFATDEVLELSETLEFETNMVVGDATDSFVL